MEVQIAALCDSAADYNGKLCVLGAFDTIGVQQLPAVHPHCAIALRVKFTGEDEGRHTMKVSLIDEDGRSLLPKPIPVIEIQVRLPENMFFCSNNLVMNLQGLEFKKTGQYSIDFTMDDRMIARIPLQVVLLQKPPQ